MRVPVRVMRRISRSWIFAFLVSHSAVAAGICDRAERIPEVAMDPGMRLAFGNAGGLRNGGVCWWHSRFQRAAWYLASFDPARPAPSPVEAKRIIRQLVARNAVVVIPGFRDLFAFSKAYEREIQAALDAWQIRDSVINQAYVRGLSGRARFRRPAGMKARLDEVFREFLAAKAKGDVLFLMLQMRGIASHASLLHAMEASADGGYRMGMVDSNFPERIVEYVYRPGDLELSPANVDVDDYASVPYAGYARDLHRIHRAVERSCATGK